MADLSGFEKMKIEKLLDMSGGYVLDFSNRTFQEFMYESAGVDIYDQKYEQTSGSKAHRLRAFWKQESNYLVGKVLSDLLEHWRTSHLLREGQVTTSQEALFSDCAKTALRLMDDVQVDDVEALKPNFPDRDFSVLATSIRESIQKNEPEAALDRLHTFAVKYVRQLCIAHGIDCPRDKPLHSLFGEYVKQLTSDGTIQSRMAERILKSAISILDAFNDVRNNQSFAHDNPILNYNESILIINSVSSSIRFIEAIEKKGSSVKDTSSGQRAEWEDIPF